MRCLTRPLLLVGVLAAPLAGADERVDRWWDSRWGRRCALTVTAGPVAVAGLPMVIRGAELKRLAGGEPMSVGSFRVIGPAGEVPCQFDDFDGAGRPASRPNHTLDDDDELVFQVDLPAAGEAIYRLYWNPRPLPPGRYPSRSLMGDALEPEAWQHDLQLWNDQALVGLRGPARGSDPAKNEIGNWGAGALVLLEVYRQPVTWIQHSWSAVFPLGAVGSRPGAEAARWERPRPLVRGPVRMAAVCTQPGVEHRVWLYERGAWVCFEEVLAPGEAAGLKPLRYEIPIRFGADPGDSVWYSERQGESLQVFAPTEAQIADGGAGKIVFQKAGLDPWVAGYSPGSGKGYAIVLDTGEAGPTEQCTVSCFARAGLTLRYDRQAVPPGAGRSVLQRFWVIGWPGSMDGREALAAWKALSRRPMRIGPVEKRGGP